jgi:glycosyltransferase involved in cell wall biosynthesis
MTTALARHASERDVVFIPNATHRHILAVATYLYRSPLTIAPEFVLLLRYDISASYRDGAGRLMRNINPIYGALYKLAFDRLNDCTTPHSVRLYSDSAELAQEYQNVCARPVECLPIPHTQADAPLQQGDLAPIRRPDVIRIVYLGDARAEKGFALLPAIVQATNARGLATKVEFVFQAYISSSYHQEMEQYIHELRSIGAPNVTLLERALSSEEYHALVHSADIVLILYDQGTYACRTSGPFTEALCAGKPVIVPDCTWMSRQLQGSGAGVVYDGVTIGDLLSAVFRAIETVSSLKHGAELLGEKLRKYHNPERFLSMLMGEQS